MATFLSMLVILFAMLLTLAVAGLVVVFVAFIQRDQDIPGAPWLTGALRRLQDRWSVPTEPPEHRDPARRLQVRRGGIRRSSER